MNRPLALTAAIVVSLGSCLLHAGAASAERVAWSVSIGGPGYAINVGEPGYRGGTIVAHGPRYPGAWRPGYRAAYVPVGPAPVAYAPVAYPSVPWVAPLAYLPPVVYAAPYAVAPFGRVPVYAPRRVVVAAPVLPPPHHRYIRY